MAKVITFSRVFPSYHPRKGEKTYFVEGILNSIGVKVQSELKPGVREIINDFFMLDGTHLKHHTIRAGKRWKEGDMASLRVWGDNINKKTGKKGPYQSNQIIIAPDIEIKKVWDIQINNWYDITINNKRTSFNIEKQLHKNDGLEWHDFTKWFNKLPFTGQIICWNENINY